MKRSGKWYRNNEAKVMKMLGLKPTINSGSGPIEKEDGQSEDLICQLKSTDANSIKVVKKDLDTLEYNAMVAHKLPIFAIQFIQSGDIWLLMKPSQVEDVAQYIETGEIKVRELFDLDTKELEEAETCPAIKSRVKSSSSARERFRKQNELKFKKEKSAL